MATNHSSNKLSSDLYLGMIEVLKGFISKIRVDDGGWSLKELEGDLTSQNVGEGVTLPWNSKRL